VKTTIRLGCGAGYAGDRIEPAVELAERGELDYLVFECLAERTIALAQLAKAKDPGAGYDPLLRERMQAVLPACRARGVRIITNMGGANPPAAAAVVVDVARALGLGGLKIATITGDDVLDVVRADGHVVAGTGRPISDFGDRLVSANAYLGIAPVIEALAAGADVVVAGRLADPALFLAPLVHEFTWSRSDWTRLGAGTLAGHLLECAGQVTGGYFADPGCKDIDGLARLGFPIAEVASDGTAIVTKVAGSGGAVTTATCTEQLLYEIHDPSAYLTPDVTADFSHVRIREIGRDRVRVEGADGRPRPDTIKVTLGYRDGFIGEGQISYAGTGALERARLAKAIVLERIDRVGIRCEELRGDIVGVDALHGELLSGRGAPPYEVRLRVAARTATLSYAVRVGNEVEALYTNGPSGGGGATKTTREVLAAASTFIPRDRVRPSVHVEVA
jgi:hypothetical protein